MAQLIKLQDYISRYEWNPYHYPTQFIRLKRENWNKLRQQWEQEFAFDESGETWDFLREEDPVESRFTQLETERELVKYFLDELFPFQMKWATSAVSQVSYIDKKFNYDPTLKYFLQRFPDIYLLMYYPVFNIKQAPVDGDIVLISPIGIELIKLVEKDDDVTIMASDERTWTIEYGGDIKKELSPLISLRRNEKIINSILKKAGIEFPVHKTVLSRTNPIVYLSEPYNTSIIGKADYERWFKEKRALSAPLKSEQLKAMEALLLHCQTTSIKRPEWLEDEDELFYIEND